MSAHGLGRPIRVPRTGTGSVSCVTGRHEAVIGKVIGVIGGMEPDLKKKSGSYTVLLIVASRCGLPVSLL
jgi:hypothetical protein